MKQIVIFGAKSIALGACLAIKRLYSEYEVAGFMVSSLSGNESCLCGLPVREIDSFADKNIWVLIATPEDVQESIETMLKDKGFRNILCLDSGKESALMGRYFECIKKFPALKGKNTIKGKTIKDAGEKGKKEGKEFLADKPMSPEQTGRNRESVEVYMAKFYRDKPLKNDYRIPDWVRPIQVGAALTEERISAITDDTGVNISAKNVNYCELTALYWMWKNKLRENTERPYFGLFHYRRFLDLEDEDLLCMERENVDVVLPYPTIHEPDISEHHGRYLGESDWEAMLKALLELEPEYAREFPGILKQPYLYNYNIFVAKRDILRDYCQWLFPILERTEELSNPRGWERADRYIGYLGENLLTLYFMYHAKKWNIRHVGRKMLI